MFVACLVVVAYVVLVGSDPPAADSLPCVRVFVALFQGAWSKKASVLDSYKVQNHA